MRVSRLTLLLLFVFFGKISAIENNSGQGLDSTKVVKEDSTKKTIESLDQKVKGMTKFDGLFTFYQDTTDGNLFMLIKKVRKVKNLFILSSQ